MDLGVFELELRQRLPEIGPVRLLRVAGVIEAMKDTTGPSLYSKSVDRTRQSTAPSSSTGKWWNIKTRRHKRYVLTSKVCRQRKWVRTDGPGAKFFCRRQSVVMLAVVEQRFEQPVAAKRQIFAAVAATDWRNVWS